jgi:hypothetical protein
MTGTMSLSMRPSQQQVLVSAALACLALLPAVSASQPAPPVRLSVATDGTQADGNSNFVIDLSRDGSQVLFDSAATNLAPGDTNNVTDLFIRDRDTDRDGVLDEPGAVRTIRVSEGISGQQVTSAVSPNTAHLTPTNTVCFAPAGIWTLMLLLVPSSPSKRTIAVAILSTPTDLVRLGSGGVGPTQ